MHIWLTRQISRVLAKLPTNTQRMASAEVLEKLEAQAVQAENLIQFLRSELVELETLAEGLKKKAAIRNQREYDQIQEENTKLKKEIGIWKIRLQDAEKKNRSPLSVAIDALETSKTPECADLLLSATPEIQPKVEKSPTTREPKKTPVEKSKGGAAPNHDDLPIDVGRLDLRIGKIVSVKKHPDADSLYVEEVDLAEPKTRTVVSGLVKYVSLEDMQDRMVVLLCNLKPAKMRGITSEAMVMCASTPSAVEILLPPPGASPGDEIHVDGYARTPDPVLNPKKKIFETVAPDLKTDGSKIATYKGKHFIVPGKGAVTAPSLINVNIK